jgi:hypothetical protein
MACIMVGMMDESTQWLFAHLPLWQRNYRQNEWTMPGADFKIISATKASIKKILK